MLVARGQKPVAWRLGVNQRAHECLLGALLVPGLALPERETSLGPQDQQIPVESNWLWNNNSPFGKQTFAFLHNGFIDLQGPCLFPWASF